MTYDPRKPNKLPDPDEVTLRMIFTTLWTDKHHRAATREGWTLWDARGSQAGAVQVQAYDDPDEGVPVLKGDDEAFLIVMRGTGKHHRMAREIVKKYNPEDFARMVHTFTEAA
jgi:hypothetical protein